jgi:hypothetical protein
VGGRDGNDTRPQRVFEDLDYAEPIVDHADAVAEFRARRES